MAGSIALVGSGEYLPEMLELEQILLDEGVKQGKRACYVQIPTAAGLEGKDRLEYWKNLGAKQAARLGVEQVFLPIYERDDANNFEFVKMLEESALVYLSGGNPAHLAESLRGTLLADAIFRNWQTGGSVAGCSAGAMALCTEVVGFRFSKDSTVEGLGLVQNLKVLPHYDRYFRFVPELAIKKLVRESSDAVLVGIDELTALSKFGDSHWQVFGKSGVHLLHQTETISHSHGELVSW
ncbi:MAG: Type 1 glutamine amidotransferase-like domain-containing protein [Candidatus Nanopelagicales bacterium]